MSTAIAIGFSQAPIISDAVTTASLSVKNQLKKNPDLVFILACPGHSHQDALNIIHTILKPRRLIGSSTSGIMLAEGIFNRGIAVLGICSTDISFGITSTTQDPITDMRQAGVDWGHRITADAQQQRHEGCLLFANHLNPLDPSFILGIKEILGNGSPLYGAIASDDLKFQHTNLFYQQQIITDGITGLLIHASKIAVGNAHGFKPLGKPRHITKASGNIIESIDGQPALNIYKEFLGKEAETLSLGPFSMHAALYPLGIYLEDQGKYLIKNAVDITMEGSIVVTGDVPQGAEVHLMIGNRESCRTSMLDALSQVKTALNGHQAKLLLILESSSRQKILRNNANSMVVAIREALGYTTPMIGMYGYGEITPLSSAMNASNIYLQNGSITIIAIE